MMKRVRTRGTHRWVFLCLVSYLLLQPCSVNAYHRNQDIISGTHGTSDWVITQNGTLKIYEGKLGLGQHHLWWENRDRITKVEFVEDVEAHVNSTTLFGGFEYVTEIVGLEKFDTSKVMVFESFFRNMRSIKHLDLRGMSTDSGINMISMFDGMEALEKLDISEFDTEEAMFFNTMFRNVKALKTLDVSHFDTGNLCEAEDMFYGMSALVDLKMMAVDLGSLDINHSIFKGAHDIQILRLHEAFSFGDNPDLFELHDIISSPAFDDTLYTGLWQNVGEGTIKNPLGNFIFSTSDLLALYKEIKMHDTYVWQPIRIVEEIPDGEFEVEGDIVPDEEETPEVPEEKDSEDNFETDNETEIESDDQYPPDGEDPQEDDMITPKDKPIESSNNQPGLEVGDDELPNAGMINSSQTHTGFAFCALGFVLILLKRNN